MAHSVLIVDNAPYARERLRLMLEAHGYRVVGEAGDTKNALAQYEKFKPDVVTLDLMLDGEHGFKTLGLLKKADPQARVIVVSAIADQGTLDRSLMLGAAAYVTKAGDWSQLESTLAKVLKAPESPKA
jgi:two-component system chemotaxis response regulator CheY